MGAVEHSTAAGDVHLPGIGHTDLFGETDSPPVRFFGIMECPPVVGDLEVGP
jgi:hypothetical protein